jgi:hypothetical protein
MVWLRCCTSTEAEHSEIGILRFKELSCYWSTPSTEYCAIGNLKGYGIPTVGPGTKSTLSTRSKQCGDAVILSSSTVGLQSLFTKALVQELVWTLSLCKPRTDVLYQRDGIRLSVATFRIRKWSFVRRHTVILPMYLSPRTTTVLGLHFGIVEHRL